VSLRKSIIATIMAFGCGVLVAALTFSLVEEAFNLSQSIPPVVIGFILGYVWQIEFLIRNLLLVVEVIVVIIVRVSCRPL
jgi:hypothetical protein